MTGKKTMLPWSNPKKIKITICPLVEKEKKAKPKNLKQINLRNKSKRRQKSPLIIKLMFWDSLTTWKWCLHYGSANWITLLNYFKKKKNTLLIYLKTSKLLVLRKKPRKALKKKKENNSIKNKYFFLI